jgi:ABC-type phosphate/phosphonate transport system permease subunit
MFGTAMWLLRMVVNGTLTGAIVALVVAFCAAQATRSPVALVPVLIAGGVFGAVAGLIRPDIIEKYSLWFV